ncbi:MAG: D-ribose pyranase [Phascolarctobacterium sp.]|uniref:D-ribose pyranase n=1 Tax=Phascolarctobacterium sp. TaxID=2049039 RepID=UPI0026DC5879|nr:D-ribose pyranase [Phascolarctobacterium sp.]MDO4922040.1 D-ribose pyranase [Phascolarctobacterium sp.]
MQKGGMLNSAIAKVLADLGHTDTIVIGDCGLPVPAGVQKIDLALKLGTPSFMEVVTEVAKNMVIEKVEIAGEMEGRNPQVFAAMKALFPTEQWLVDVDHEAFKEATKKAKCVIRTGEITPYANVILHSNVFF